MHCYVTGGMGFCGSHLVDLLLAYGHEVTIIDNMSRGKNLPITTGGWNVCLADLAEKCPDFERHSVVFHLAAKVTGIEYNRFHHYDMQAANDIINHNVLEAVRRSNPRLFVATSTVCIYPPDAPVPTPERVGEICDAERSNWGYGVSKFSMEQRAKSLCAEYGIPTIIVRPSNMFGTNDHYDEGTSHVIPALIKRIVDGENPVWVWGSGRQTRSFLDAKDMATAYVKLMEWGLKHPPSTGAVILNVGHAREVTIRYVAELLIHLCVEEMGLPVAPELLFDTGKPDGYPRRGSDVSALKALIGWVPDRLLETTCREMIREYIRTKSGFKQV